MKLSDTHGKEEDIARNGKHETNEEGGEVFANSNTMVIKGSGPIKMSYKNHGKSDGCTTASGPTAHSSAFSSNDEIVQQYNHAILFQVFRKHDDSISSNKDTYHCATQ